MVVEEGLSCADHLGGHMTYSGHMLQNMKCLTRLID